MQISRSHLHRWLCLVAFPSTSCSEAAIGTGTDPGSTGSTSTGEAPDTPTSAGPTGPDDGSSTSTGAGPDTTGSTGPADPGDLCGDGFTDPGEGCDAGPANGPYAACTDTCQVNVCGDGKVLLGAEECDEGPANIDSGYCRSDCRLGVCGDGFLLPRLEECDAATAASEAYGMCDANCTVNRCGDGHVDPGHEECDDGPNNGVGDGGDGKAGCDLECGFAGRRLFLSSQEFDGELGGRAGADLACQNLAGAAGFRSPEHFRALLADAEVGPADFVLEDLAGRPFILPSGLIVAANYAALIQDGPGTGITMTETGQALHGQWVWTNLNVAGTAYLKDAASTCASWTSDGIATSARVGWNSPPPGDAAALATWKFEKQWLSFDSNSCKYLRHLYCIEAT